MTAYVEFVETETIFGKSSRIRQTIEILKCGKNRRDFIVKKKVKTLYPNLTLNRIILYNK
jgi:hypothetical protein